MKGTTRADESVVHPRRVAANGHEPGTAQVRQVARYRWLGKPKHRDEVADADFAFREQMKHSKPCAIGQRTEQAIYGRNGTLQHSGWDVRLCEVMGMHVLLDHTFSFRALARLLIDLQGRDGARCGPVVGKRRF